MATTWSGGLALGEDDLRHAVTQRAVVIHLGEAQILEGHVAHAFHRGVDVHCTVAHLLEQRPELLLIHDIRVSECANRASSCNKSTKHNKGLIVSFSLLPPGAVFRMILPAWARAIRTRVRPDESRRIAGRPRDSPLREEVRYTVQNSKTAKMSGTGRTLDFASGGILFTTEELLPVGRRVELSVSWPARLGGTCPLQFVATGRVVRAESDRAAVRIER